LKFAVTCLVRDQVQGWKHLDNHSEHDNEVDAINECEYMQELMKESSAINYGVEAI